MSERHAKVENVDAKARVQRVDYYASADLSAAQQTPEGFLRIDGRISRVGCQSYQNADGTEHVEYRPPEEVFDPESIASFKLLPLTNTHPTQLLDDVSAKRHAVGAVGEDIRQDGDFLRTPMLLHDRDAISAARAGRSQLSAGYSCELDWTPGVYNGQKYDAVQRSIRGNHVAIVDAARAGPEARFRLDAARNALIESISQETVSSDTSSTENEMPPVLRIDGHDVQINDSNVPVIQQLVDRAITAAKKDGEDLRAKLDTANATIKTFKANVAAHNAKLDAKKAKMVDCDSCDGTGKTPGDDGEEQKCDYCDGAGQFRMHEAIATKGEGKEAEDDDTGEEEPLDEDELGTEQATENESKSAAKDKKADAAHVVRQRRVRAKVDAMVERETAKRAALLDIAKRALGLAWKADGKTNVDIKRAILNKLAPEVKADKLDGVRLASEFRAVVRYKLDAAATVSASDRLRSVTAPTVVQTDATDVATTQHLDADAARSTMIKRNADAWKRPAK